MTYDVEAVAAALYEGVSHPRNWIYATPSARKYWRKVASIARLAAIDPDSIRPVTALHEERGEGAWA